MDYSVLIKKSFEISWNNKILWIFGILSGGFSTIFYIDPSMFTYSFSGSDNPFQPQIEEGGRDISSRVLGATDQSLSSISTETWLIAGLIFAVFILIVLLIVIFISTWANASLIYSIFSRNIQKPSFLSGAKGGVKYWWRYYLLSLIFGLVFLGIFLLLAIPVIFLFIAGEATIAFGLLIFNILIFLLIMFVLSIVATLIITLSQRMLIHRNTGVLESIRLSGGLLKKHFGDSVLTYFVAIGVNFAFSFCLMFVLIPILVLLFFLIIMKMWWVALVLMLPFGILLAVFGGFIQTFAASYWTLFYEHLASKEGW